jgi:hypothetical protein
MECGEEVINERQTFELFNLKKKSKAKYACTVLGKREVV